MELCKLYIEAKNLNRSNLAPVHPIKNQIVNNVYCQVRNIKVQILYFPYNYSICYIESGQVLYYFLKIYSKNIPTQKL